MSVVIDGTLGIDTIQANTVTSAKIVDATIAPADLSGAQSGSAPIYGARAWCRFDGTLTGTNAPIAGGNVTSVTRSSTGNYVVNYTTAMPTGSYVVVTSTNGVGAGGIPYHGVTATATGNCTVITANAASYVDNTLVFVAVFA